MPPRKRKADSAPAVADEPAVVPSGLEPLLLDSLKKTSEMFRSNANAALQPDAAR